MGVVIVMMIIRGTPLHEMIPLMLILQVITMRSSEITIIQVG